MRKNRLSEHYALRIDIEASRPHLKVSVKEKAFANLLREEGLDFEQWAKDLPGTPDIFFREERLAVFFHGCYWHNHDCKNQKIPANPVTASKRAAQALTDREQQTALLDAGYKYVIVWECEYDESPLSQVAKVKNRLHFT